MRRKTAPSRPEVNTRHVLAFSLLLDLAAEVKVGDAKGSLSLGPHFGEVRALYNTKKAA